MLTRIYRKVIITGSTIIVLLWLPLENQAQSVKRSCISCYGSSAVAGNLLIRQTAGQNYYTLASDQEKTIVLQGFQQPVYYAMTDIKTSSPEKLRFSISPNPASYSMTIKCGEALENPHVVVTDLNGRNIFSQKIPDVSDHMINCETWDNGVYYLTIYSDPGLRQTMKIIILK